MGLYIWIASGFVVGTLARVLVPKRVNADWLESILMGIAGAVVGGWIGARVWGDNGIDYVGWPGILAACIAAALMVGTYIGSRRRRVPRVAQLPASDETHRRAA